MKKTSILDINRWLHTLNRATSGELSCPGFLKPYHLVTLAIMLKQNNAQWIELSAEIESYALRMGLWDALGITPPYEQYAYPTQNQFLPVAPLEDPSTTLHTAKNLIQLVYQQNLGLQAFESVEIMLMELLENTYKHARVNDKLHGLVCAQSWPKGNLAQIVFADPGIGVRNSLSENQLLGKKLKITNSCQLACELGITSKPEAHSGYGLALTKGLMKQSQGQMIVLSHHEGVCITQQKETTFEAPFWQGTLIILEWPINQTLDVGAVYASWPLPEGFEIHDFE
ncbi:MAG: sensor histidine kinase [Proteobacteria bacterium]|nr:sensor histidine kinase [Pseudomonadota bacterium]